VLLASLGLKVSGIEGSEWPLFVNQYSLTLLFQISVMRLNTAQMGLGGDSYENTLHNEIALIWHSFLSSLKAAIIKREHELINIGKHHQILKW